LADDGILIVTIGVELQSGDIVIGPDVDSHGVLDEAGDLHQAVADRVRDSVRTLERPIDQGALRRRVRNSARRAAQARISRRPVVLPVVLEV
jgi:mRNA degradation ribonuclease J1/J2